MWTCNNLERGEAESGVRAVGSMCRKRWAGMDKVLSCPYSQMRHPLHSRKSCFKFSTRESALALYSRFVISSGKLLIRPYRPFFPYVSVFTISSLRHVNIRALSVLFSFAAFISFHSNLILIGGSTMSLQTPSL